MMSPADKPASTAGDFGNTREIRTIPVFSSDSRAVPISPAIGPRLVTPAQAYTKARELFVVFDRPCKSVEVDHNLSAINTKGTFCGGFRLTLIEATSFVRTKNSAASSGGFGSFLLRTTVIFGSSSGHSAQREHRHQISFKDRNEPSVCKNLFSKLAIRHASAAEKEYVVISRFFPKVSPASHSLIVKLRSMLFR